MVKEGDYVSVGQTLAIVRSDVINVNAQTAKSSYQNAKADYADMKMLLKQVVLLNNNWIKQN